MPSDFARSSTERVERPWTQASGTTAARAVPAIRRGSSLPRTTSCSDLRRSRAAMLDSVAADHEPVLVTRGRGEPPAMPMSLEDFASHEETRRLPQSQENAERLLDAVRDLDAGEGEARELAEWSPSSMNAPGRITCTGSRPTRSSSSASTPSSGRRAARSSPGPASRSRCAGPSRAGGRGASTRSDAWSAARPGTGRRSPMPASLPTGWIEPPRLRTEGGIDVSPALRRSEGRPRGERPWAVACLGARPSGGFDLHETFPDFLRRREAAARARCGGGDGGLFQPAGFVCRTGEGMLARRIWPDQSKVVLRG